MEAAVFALRRIFPTILRMSLSAGVLALVVLALRLALGKAPKWVRCLLWALVAVRLLCPILPESRASLMPRSTLPATVDTTHPAVEFETPQAPAVSPPEGETDAPVSREAPLRQSLPILWAAGVLVMLLYAAGSYLRLRRRVRVSVPLDERVQLCDEIDTPFILGVLRPRIYLPSGLAEPQRAHVLAHERAHLARRDHWWKPLGFVLLAVHWFNPVLWLAYVLLCRDVELACDERVVRGLDREGIAGYSQALLACGAARARIAACPLAFGEVGVKQRVKNVLYYKKPAFWIVCTAIVACIAAGICFLTEPASGQREDAWDKRPALYIDGVYYVDPYMPISYLPFGFSGAGTLTKAQANDTGLAGTDYYTNPEDPSCFFTYQLCGTPTGLNEVDSGRLTWQYVRWVPVDAVQSATRPLTLDDVRRLAEKGEALTWDDLALFDSYDASEQWDPTESEGDPYIRVCPIEAMFELRIGGESPKTPPRYVYLRNCDINAWCEIRTKDVGAFLDIYQQKNGHADMNRLVEKYPEYFDLPTDRGLAVYVWQMSEYSYSCALLPDSGKTREPTELWNLKGANLVEMRLILSTYDISPEKVAVIPWINPLSSYSYSVDEDYIETLRMRLIAYPYPNLLEDYSGDLTITWENAAEEVAAVIRETKEGFQLEDYQVNFYDHNEGFATIDYTRMVGAFETDSQIIATIISGKLRFLTDITKEPSEEEKNRLLALTERLGVSRQTEEERTVSVQNGERPTGPKELTEALRLALEQTSAIPRAKPIQQRYSYYYEAESRTASILVFTDYAFDDTGATDVDVYSYSLD